MSFQPHKLSEDKLESIYLENIDKIRKYNYSKIGLTCFTISESNISVLLNNFRKYKIIGFNIGKFGDFIGAQRNYVTGFVPMNISVTYPNKGSVKGCVIHKSLTSPQPESKPSKYFSFLIYIIYVDIAGNCYGQIQSEKINFECYQKESTNWNTELFVKPFSIPLKSYDITTEYELIMKCISKNLLLEYSYPEYKEVYKSYISNKRFPNIEYDSPSTGFSDLIGITIFKNIGNKCNERKRYKIQIIEEKQKIELEQKLLEDKRIEEELKKIEEENLFCRKKVNSLNR